jgi:hypothetical protein
MFVMRVGESEPVYGGVMRKERGRMNRGYATSLREWM